MFSLSVHLPIVPKDEDSEEAIDVRQKANIKLLNLLRKNGFETYCRDPYLNTITRISRGSEHIIYLNRVPIWAVNEFDELPIDIIKKISTYDWVTFTLQKINPDTPSD